MIAVGGRVRLDGGLLRFARGGQVEPDGGPGRVLEVAPLGGEMLDQEQAVALGGVQVTLHDRGSRGAVIDDLDQYAVRDADDDDGDRSSIGARPGVLNRVGDDFGSQ
jgi:hypothetical protein